MTAIPFGRIIDITAIDGLAAPHFIRCAHRKAPVKNCIHYAESCNSERRGQRRERAENNAFRQIARLTNTCKTHVANVPWHFRHENNPYFSGRFSRRVLPMKSAYGARAFSMSARYKALPRGMTSNRKAPGKAWRRAVLTGRPSCRKFNFFKIFLACPAIVYKLFISACTDKPRGDAHP